ncbi:MAG TPA: RNA polymerase sigma factor region1.1 domain-containing protein, partial [Rhizomicrobium sp.]|nr:RNA polymerase sigma factor region1.1 domain-containing protein [Rhizomicrobium sp.]
MTKTSAKKNKKPQGKSAKAKPAKSHAKAATAKAVAVKKKPNAKPAAKAAKAATPATKSQAPAKKPEAKTSVIKHPEAKSELKNQIKTDVAAPKPVLPTKKPDGKVAPQAKAGVKGPGEPGEGQPDADSPLLDMSDVGVRKMITRAKQRGYVTYDELNKVLPSDKVSSEQIEDTMSMLNEMGINVIESEEQDEQAEVPALAQGKQVATKSGDEEEQYDRTDDPVRMYLREMGSVELLSREGEIAIAKRIEAGRELMIGALCESPLTFEALTVWRDELNEGKVLLRDIIDLEAMYGAGPDAQAAQGAEAGENTANGVAPPQAMNGHDMAAAPAPRAEVKKPEPAPKPANGEEMDEGERVAAAEAAAEDQDFDDEGNLSLSAMEAALKPQVLETLDQIASLYKKLGKLQDASVEAALGSSDELSTGQERRFKKLRTDTIDLVKSLKLN